VHGKPKVGLEAVVGSKNASRWADGTDWHGILVTTQAGRGGPVHLAAGLWALLAAGQITMRKVDGWRTLLQKVANMPIDLAA
jgi:hypothetical protein